MRRHRRMVMHKNALSRRRWEKKNYMDSFICAAIVLTQKYGQRRKKKIMTKYRGFKWFTFTFYLKIGKLYRSIIINNWNALFFFGLKSNRLFKSRSYPWTYGELVWTTKFTLEMESKEAMRKAGVSSKEECVLCGEFAARGFVACESLALIIYRTSRQSEKENMIISYIN